MPTKAFKLALVSLSRPSRASELYGTSAAPPPAPEIPASAGAPAELPLPLVPGSAVTPGLS
jgi:hypothetical protein